MDKTKGRINMSDLIIRPRMLNLKGLMPVMVAPDKKTLKKSVKSMFFMVQTRCEVETIKY